MPSKKLVAILIVVLSMVSGSALATAVTTPRWFQPLFSLPRSDLSHVECIIHAESTSTLEHPNLGDDNGNMPGQSGIFQMANQPGGVWDTYVFPKLHIRIWRATAFQQAEGFVMVVRVDGFSPWDGFDGC